MARVKLPLEMANGVMARTIEELKENFDIKKVVGYFLDGKLKTWLEVRYYEDELEKVNELSDTDPELTKKLCEIFDIEYINEEIDVVIIQEKNEKLLKLKQYTDDNEILANIDSVAFDQEELADLYDKGKDVIYLCEGKFKIPNSKKDLIYHIIGDADVIGLEKKEEKSNDIDNYTGSYVYAKASIIPKELADVIGEREYAESDTMVVWVKTEEYAVIDKNFFKRKNTPVFHGSLNVWDKVNDEYFCVNIIDYPDKVNQMEFAENKLVIGGGFKKNNDSGFRFLIGANAPEIRVYEIKDRRFECIYKNQCRGNFSIDKNRVAFRKYKENISDENLNIEILDLNSMKEYETSVSSRKRNTGASPETFRLIGNYLYFVKNNSIYKYDFEKRTPAEKVFEQSNLAEPMIFGYEDNVYLRYSTERSVSPNGGKVVEFNSKGIIEHFDDIYAFEKCYYPKTLHKFILNRSKGIYTFDVISKTSEFIPIDYSGNEVRKVVGNYLYYRTYNDKFFTHRIDLLNLSEGPERIN